MSLGHCTAVLKTASRANPVLRLPYRPRVRATPRRPSRNYRCYDWIASSGSVVGNDPVNGRDPSGEATCVTVTTLKIDGVAVISTTSQPYECGGSGPPGILQSAASAARAVIKPALAMAGCIVNIASCAGPFLNSAADDADAAWDEVTNGAEKDGDGQLVKPGGESEAKDDFDKARGGAEVEDKGNGVKVAVLPDGRRLVLRGSSDGRPTLQRQSPGGNTGTKIRYGQR